MIDSNKFMVQHKDTGEISFVYDIVHRNVGTFISATDFLVFIDSQFKLVSAEYFVPYTEAFTKSYNNKIVFNENTPKNYNFEDGM